MVKEALFSVVRYPVPLPSRRKLRLADSELVAVNVELNQVRTQPTPASQEMYADGVDGTVKHGAPSSSRQILPMRALKPHGPAKPCVEDEVGVVLGGTVEGVAIRALAVETLLNGHQLDRVVGALQPHHLRQTSQ